jgi:hypothetical protein
MREQRRHVSKVVSPLEMLDDRIVPSVMGPIPATVASLANHHSHHHANLANVHHLHAHVSRAHAAHRIVLAPGLGNAVARATQAAAAAPAASSTVTVQSGTAASTNASIAQTSSSSNTAATTSTPAVAVVATAPAVSGNVGTSNGTTTTAPVTSDTPTVSPSVTDLKSGPLAKAGQDLITVYEEFQHQGGGSSFTSSEAARIQIQGTSVGIDAVSTGGNFDAFVSALTSLGMQVNKTDASHGLVEGFLPISQLPAAAQNPQTLSLSAIYRPNLRS